MAKQNFRELEIMDPMEMLYYERKDRRQKAYAAKQRKSLSRNRKVSMKKSQVYKGGAAVFAQASCGAI